MMVEVAAEAESVGKGNQDIENKFQSEDQEQRIRELEGEQGRVVERKKCSEISRREGDTESSFLPPSATLVIFHSVMYGILVEAAAIGPTDSPIPR
jgi:hypothetical protein